MKRNDLTTESISICYVQTMDEGSETCEIEIADSSTCTSACEPLS
jgi:hypothetical protein